MNFNDVISWNFWWDKNSDVFFEMTKKILDDDCIVTVEAIE